MNASITTIPRLGFLGWCRNYLVLGLPLLSLLPPDEFRAVLAHEFGHLSGDHGRFGSWIYRIRSTWGQLMGELQRRRRRSLWLFQRFFEWYVPFFNAYSFVLARAHEREADRRAAEQQGARQLAQALMKLRVADTQLSREFWPAVYRLADQQERAPSDVMERLDGMFGTLSLVQVQTWFSEAMQWRTGVDDTHPALSERLEALGYPGGNLGATAQPLEAAIAARGSAALQYLGPLASQLSGELSQRWSESVKGRWRARFEYVQKARQDAKTLEVKRQSGNFPPEERWRLAELMRELDGDDVAFPHYQQLLEVSPEHPGANYRFGDVLLRRGDESGLQHLETAIRTDPDVFVPACELAYTYLKARGREQEAERYRTRATQHQDRVNAARKEREGVNRADRFLAHELEPDVVERVRAQLRQDPDVVIAYLARKTVTYFPEYPLYILGFVPSWRVRWWFGLPRQHRAVLDHLGNKVILPGEGRIVNLTLGHGWLQKRLRNMAGTEIYRV